MIGTLRAVGADLKTLVGCYRLPVWICAGLGLVIPVLFYGQHVQPQQIPPFHTFSDIGQTLAGYLGLAPLGHGTAVNIWKP
ncbi:MAG: hypothetical protein ABS965_04855, partial [Succiniclasticum sp.]